jgi:hypothetical protein
MMADDYLMMARVMDREWKEYQRENVWGKGYTGATEIAIHQAFVKAFMAGFYLKFTKDEERGYARS